jgi:hypothetical protein
MTQRESGGEGEGAGAGEGEGMRSATLRKYAYASSARETPKRERREGLPRCSSLAQGFVAAVGRDVRPLNHGAALGGG